MNVEMNNGKCGNCRSCNVREHSSEWQAQSRATTYTSMIPLPPQNSSIPSAVSCFGLRQGSEYGRAFRKGSEESRGTNKHLNSISASSACPPPKSPACAVSVPAFVWRYSPTDHSIQRTMNAALHSLHDHSHEAAVPTSSTSFFISANPSEFNAPSTCFSLIVFTLSFSA